jgi:hypothetical protein
MRGKEEEPQRCVYNKRGQEGEYNGGDLLS